ncbi:hypothetical protein HGM15179_021388 [Zosterops borbonicus]|uniref:Peptidase A2 domain-containing protein n=1 Tax=Zosterops borbonicus TaxID=364589 RepID=A0A8K1D7V0_9PASS|nr:hypothetical protein HGM15179_021388 [Zosterops borbonicus]
MVLVMGVLITFLPMQRAQALVALKAMVTISQSGVATERKQRVKAALALLVLLMDVCYRVSMFLHTLHQWLLDIKLALKEKEVSADVRKDLVAVAVKVKWLWEGSTRLAMDHLMGTLGDIHSLLLSPCGGSGVPVSPGGPGGRSVAKRCQETIGDTPGPCTEQRTAPSCGETRNGSSVTGTPEQPEGTWGKPDPGAVCDTTSHRPSHPDLLRPGTRCELATSKLIYSFKSCCHECLPVAVTGVSKQIQDFLIIGQNSDRDLGLSVLPTVVSANCDKELRVLALARKAPMVIQPKTPIAIAIAWPMNINKGAGYRETPSEGFSPAPNVRWVKHITSEEPKLECSLTYSDKTVKITGMLDTGADVTVIFHKHWPREWKLMETYCVLRGIEGDTICKQSKITITVTGPEGKTANIQPCVGKCSTVWGRDVLSQWRTKMEVDS